MFKFHSFYSLINYFLLTRNKDFLWPEDGERIWGGVESVTGGNISLKLSIPWIDLVLDALEAFAEHSVEDGNVGSQSSQEVLHIRFDCVPFVDALVVVEAEASFNLFRRGENVDSDERSDDNLLSVTE